jgi:hypothetical protein
VKRLVPTLLGLLALLAAGVAFAQPVGVRRIGVNWVDGVPRISFSARDLVTRSVREKLDSGPRQSLVMRVYGYTERGGRQIALAAVSCVVVHDVWERTYRVQRQTVGSDRTERVSTFAGVLRRCLVVDRLPVGTAADWESQRGRSVYFAALVEFNPLSRETVRRMRRWLAQPGAQTQDEAFFGSFVAVFINRGISQAERTLRLRSPNIAVP